MKLNLPLLIGALIVAGGLVALAVWKPEPTVQELTAPSVEYLRGQLRGKGKLAEGKDYSIDTPVILRRDDTEMIVRVDVRLPDGTGSREHHRLVPVSGGWKFDADVRESFDAFVAKEKDASYQRVGKQLAERYRDSVDIPGENIRLSTRLLETPVEDSKDITLKGYIDIGYVDRGGEGMYIEEFLYTKGGWEMVGSQGKIYDKGPRPGANPRRTP